MNLASRFIFAQALILAIAGTVLLFSVYTSVQLVGAILLIGGIVGVVVGRSASAEIGAVLKEAGVRVTDVVKRATLRTRRLEPKAFLLPLDGVEDSLKRELSLYGETSIGRDPEHAELMFPTGKVSRFHCMIHEEESGDFTIEDKDSANGTFLNGRQLRPFERYPLHDSDTIELGEVFRGGIRFRFSLPESPSPERPQPQPDGDNSGDHQDF